jgi:hypothetical protein
MKKLERSIGTFGVCHRRQQRRRRETTDRKWSFVLRLGFFFIIIIALLTFLGTDDDGGVSKVDGSYSSLLTLTTLPTHDDATTATNLPIRKSTTAANTKDDKNHQPSDDEVCVTDACFQDHARRIARAFSKRPWSVWCNGSHSSRSTTPNATTTNSDSIPYYSGLLYVKVPKAASSTTAGLVLHLHRRQAAVAGTVCDVHYQHRLGYLYAKAPSHASFRLGSIRDPAQRALSAVFYFILLPMLEQQQAPTASNNHTISVVNTTSSMSILQALQTTRGGKTKGKGGFQYNYLSVRPVEPRSVYKPWQPTQLQLPLEELLARLQRDVLQAYDFLLVVERLEESVVALAWLMDLPVERMILIAASAKVAASSNNNPYILVRLPGRHYHTCQRKQRPQQLDPAVAAYFQSKEWRLIHYADYVLHQAANISLDWTIQETIGANVFQAQLQLFQTLRRFVETHCGDRLGGGSGCTPEGQPILPVEDCYENDL